MYVTGHPAHCCREPRYTRHRLPLALERGCVMEESRALFISAFLAAMLFLPITPAYILHILDALCFWCWLPLQLQPYALQWPAGLLQVEETLS